MGTAAPEAFEGALVVASRDLPLPRSPGTTRRSLPDADGLRAVDPVELPETPATPVERRTGEA
ncbi:hypothetical protein ACH4LT_23720 [Streptomyces clavifer]|uniref:hypothetical protein n=1 Tax=Streptomyces clavifer TaxID=68188 RepID=UPI0037ADB324